MRMRRAHRPVQFSPNRDGNCSNLAFLANQINNGPTLFALLKMIHCQSHGFMPPQPRRELQREQGSVAFSLRPLRISCLPKRMALLCRLPVLEAPAQLLHPFYPTNTGSQIGAENTAVGASYASRRTAPRCKSKACLPSKPVISITVLCDGHRCAIGSCPSKSMP